MRENFTKSSKKLLQIQKTKGDLFKICDNLTLHDKTLSIKTRYLVGPTLMVTVNRMALDS